MTSESVGSLIGDSEGVDDVLSAYFQRNVTLAPAQEGLHKDNEVLRALVEHNRLSVGGPGPYPCTGVYGIVGAPDPLRTGDPVALG